MSKEKEEVQTEVTYGDYKGSPIITIHELDESGNKKPYPFSFSAKKAGMIVKHIEEIEAFAEENE